MPNLVQALLSIANAQEAEARVILRQRNAARERGRSLDTVADGFRAAAALMKDVNARKQFELYASQANREAHAAYLQERVHDAEAKRARMQARTSRERAAAIKAKALREPIAFIIPSVAPGPPLRKGRRRARPAPR